VEKNMIYAPGRFLFIHIPRTSGMAITAAMIRSFAASEAMENGRLSVMVSTGNEPSIYNRHATSHDLVQVLPDYDKLYKFAVYRPAKDIYESDYKLHQRSVGMVSASWVSQEWRETVELAVNETLDEFIERRWLPWMDGKDPWSYWCDESVNRLDFSLINQTWPWLLDRLGLPQSELLRINAG